MPPLKPTLRTANRRSNVSSALLAVALAGIVAAFFGSSQAASGPDRTPPSAPSNLRLLSASETDMLVGWNASSDNVGVVGYRVTLENGRPARTESTQFQEHGLSCGLSYAIEVRAYDQVKNLSEPARAVVATDPCLDLTPPSAPTGLQQIARGPTTATLAWQPATDNVAVAGYRLSRGGVGSEQTAETSFVFVGLVCGSTYSVAVRSYDVAGNDSPWVQYYVSTSPCAGDVTPPSAPTSLAQTNRTLTSVSFSWSASTDNVGVARYLVYLGSSKVAETTARSFALSGLTCATGYSVGVEAVDAAGNRSPRASATMSTAACPLPPPPGSDAQAPTAPSTLAVASSTSSSIVLTWAASVDNVGVTGYSVLRNGMHVGVVSKPGFAHTGLSCGMSYQLGVDAFDAAGNHSAQTKVTAGTVPCVADPTAPSQPGNVVLLSRTSTSVTVSWVASSDNVGVAGYNGYVDGVKAGSTSETTYTFAGLACGTSRTFGIDAYDAAGNRSSRSSVILQTAACGDIQKPSTPTQLAVSGVAQTAATLKWAASSDNVGVAGYDVYVNASKVATVTGTSSAVSNLACNTAVTLGVEAFDAGGNRSARATTSMTTSACSTTTPPPTTGAGTKYVASNGSDAASCTQSAPCATFNRAWLVAKPGEVVEVAGGTYSEQTLDADATKASTSDVVFKPAAGASVTLVGFAAGDNKTGVGPKHFELRDLKIQGTLRVAWGTEDVTLRNIDAGVLNLTSTRRVKVYGGDFGPWTDGVSHINACGVSGCFPAEDILIEGALFHDFTITDPDKHSECLMIWPGRRVTIRGSTFRNCTDFDVLVKPYNTGLVGSPADITLENNFFDDPMPGETATKNCNPGCPRSGNAVAITDGSGEAWSGAVIRYNSSLGGIRIDTAVRNAVVKGNVARKDSNFSCTVGVSFGFNVWNGAKCASSDRTASLSDVFVGASSSSFDLHLRTGAVAIGGGDPGDYPSRDRDGDGRPMGGAPDSGADERT